MKMKVNKECIGCGLCPEICPEVFLMQEDGFAKAVEDNVPKEFENSAKEAMDSCPVSAIETE